MKRTRLDGGGGGGGEEELLTLDMMARCLVLLSQQSVPVVHGSWSNKKPKMETAAHESKRVGDMFECKTCGRRFSSFQALGGHRASHKLMQKSSTKPPSEPISKADKGSGGGVSAGNSRMHECSICGLGFAMGQALGGHMRKHRTDLMNGMALYPADPIPMIPVLKRTNSTKRITCLDLNLTPLENDLKLVFGNVAPNLNLHKQQF